MVHRLKYACATETVLVLNSKVTSDNINRTETRKYNSVLVITISLHLKSNFSATVPEDILNATGSDLKAMRCPTLN